MRISSILKLLAPTLVALVIIGFIVDYGGRPEAPAPLVRHENHDGIEYLKGDPPVEKIGGIPSVQELSRHINLWLKNMSYRELTPEEIGYLAVEGIRGGQARWFRLIANSYLVVLEFKIGWCPPNDEVDLYLRWQSEEVHIFRCASRCFDGSDRLLDTVVFQDLERNIQAMKKHWKEQGIHRISRKVKNLTKESIHKLNGGICDAH